jgi:iron complex outermembrane receptor protein
MNRSSRGRSAVRSLLIASVSALVIAGSAGAANAQGMGRTHRYDIPAGDAVTALQSYAKQSGKQILFPYDAASGRRTPAVKGQFTEAAS